MDADAVIHQHLDFLNQQNWSGLSQVLAGSLSYNDKPTAPDDFLRLLQDDVKTLRIATWRLDILVHDRQASTVGARLLVIARGTTKTEVAIAAHEDRPFEYPQHVVFVVNDGKISEIRAIKDTDMADQTLERVDPSPAPLSKERGHLPSLDMTWFYTSYIRCINEKTMETELHKYCNPHVMWCDGKLPIDEYRKLMEDTFDAIPGLVFDVRDLIVDEERQQIFSRIEFTGTPVRPYAGAEPNGRSVRFAEHAIYWLEGGKIARVVTVIDWQSYRRQLSS